MEITALAPITKSDTDTSGFEIKEGALFPSRVASNPSMVMPIARTSTRLVLHTVYRYVVRAMVGIEISVERAIRALARPILRPAATKLPASPSSGRTLDREIGLSLPINRVAMASIGLVAARSVVIAEP